MINLMLLLGKSIAGILILGISVVTGTSEPSMSRFLIEKWHQDLVSKTCQQPLDKISFYLEASRDLASKETFESFEKDMKALLGKKSASSKSLDILKLLESKRDELKYNYHHDRGGILRDVLYFTLWIQDYLSGVMGLSTKRPATQAERALSRKLVQQSAFLAKLDLQDVLSGSDVAPYQPSLPTMPKGHFRFLNTRHKEAQVLFKEAQVLFSEKLKPEGFLAKLKGNFRLLNARHKEAQSQFSEKLKPGTPLATIQTDWECFGKKKFEERKAALKKELGIYATYLREKDIGWSLTSPFTPPSGRGALSMSIVGGDYIVAAYARENGETYSYLHLVITEFCTGVSFSEETALKAGTTISLVPKKPLVCRIETSPPTFLDTQDSLVTLGFTVQEYLYEDQEKEHVILKAFLDSVFATTPGASIKRGATTGVPQPLQHQPPPKTSADDTPQASDKLEAKQPKSGSSQKKTPIPSYPPPPPPLKQPEKPKPEADPLDGPTPSQRQEPRLSRALQPQFVPEEPCFPSGPLPIQIFIQQPPFHPQYQPWRTSPQSLVRPPAFVPGTYPESFPPSAPPLDSPPSSLYPKLDPQVVPTKPLPVPPPKPKHLVGGVALVGMGPSPGTGKK